MFNRLKIWRVRMPNMLCTTGISVASSTPYRNKARMRLPRSSSSRKASRCTVRQCSQKMGSPTNSRASPLASTSAQEAQGSIPNRLRSSQITPHTTTSTLIRATA
jgi:hypothetical protein